MGYSKGYSTNNPINVGGCFITLDSVFVVVTEVAVCFNWSESKNSKSCLGSLISRYNFYYADAILWYFKPKLSIHITSVWWYNRTNHNRHWHLKLTTISPTYKSLMTSVLQLCWCSKSVGSRDVCTTWPMCPSVMWWKCRYCVRLVLDAMTIKLEYCGKSMTKPVPNRM